MQTLVDGFHSSARSIPRIVDEILENALGSLESAAGSMFRDDLQVDFALLKDEGFCVVRLYLPNNSRSPGHSAPRKVYVSVIGRQHLRVKINMTFAGITTEVTKTIQVPYPVSKDDVEISSKPDGSVHVKLRILTENATDVANISHMEDSLLRGPSEVDSLLGRLFPALFAPPSVPDSSGSSSGSQELVREMPSADAVSHCKATFGPERLLLSKCLCDATSDTDSRAICYGSLISRCVRTARKLGRDDFATTSKHLAIECAAGSKDRAKCLEGVVRDVLASLYARGKDGQAENVAERIRLAIESEDDGPGEFTPSGGAVFIKNLLVIVVGIVAVAVVGVLYVKLRGGKLDVKQGVGKTQLSSVMTQRSASRDGERSSAGVAARGRGGHERDDAKRA